MLKLPAHVRQNAVAYVALFVALGGTGYAAINLPAGSVGTRQLRNGAVTANKLANGSISPAKLDRGSLGGAVRYWAQVRQDGHILGGSRGARASLSGAEYTVTWGTKFPSSCAALVTPAAVPGIAPIANGTGVGISSSGPRKTTVVYVWTYSNGNPTPAPFNIAVVC